MKKIPKGLLLSSCVCGLLVTAACAWFESEPDEGVRPTTANEYELDSDIYCYGLKIEDGKVVDINNGNIYYLPVGPGSFEGIRPSTRGLQGGVVEGEILELERTETHVEPVTVWVSFAWFAFRMIILR